MKKCQKCGRELPETEFYKNRAQKDGLQTYCKDCIKERDKLRSLNRKHSSSPFSSPPPKKNKRDYNPSNPLSNYTPRELMTELHNRGYTGKLSYIYEIDISKI